METTNKSTPPTASRVAKIQSLSKANQTKSTLPKKERHLEKESIFVTNRLEIEKRIKTHQKYLKLNTDKHFHPI